MKTNNKGQAVLNAIFLPTIFLCIMMVAGTIYYACYRTYSQYYAYQYLLCNIHYTDKLCQKNFYKKLAAFPFVKIRQIKSSKANTNKSYKLQVKWQESFAYITKINRRDSVYISK